MELLRIAQEHPYLNVIQPWYELSFPLEERREFAQLRQLLGCSDMHLNVLIEAQQLVGFIIYWQWDDVLYIEHFAIDPEQRGKQFGEKALQLITSRELAYIILEVELPDNQVSQRRVRFYERQGFVLNPYAYTQPPYKAGGVDIPMKVMSIPALTDSVIFTRLSRLLKEKVYERFY